MAEAKYYFRTGSGEIVTIEADSNETCQDLVIKARKQHPKENIIDVYSEHVYPLPYQKRNTGKRSKDGVVIR